MLKLAGCLLLVVIGWMSLCGGRAVYAAEKVGGALPRAAVFDPHPPSTLLPSGSTAFTLTVQSATNTTCAYAVGTAKPYVTMTRFDQGAETTSHQTVVRGLDADPNTVNQVYVRCAAEPDFVLALRYRSLSPINPAYPRTGNLWGWWNFANKPLADVARIDLWLGADFPPAQIRQLRQRNPNILILTSMNAVEEANLPDDYYLKDIHGNKVEVWPGSYRLNLTKPYVAEYQAHLAYNLVLKSELLLDGVFIDNVFTSQSWQTQDIYGNPFLIDANEDSLQDDPAAFDAAWKAGVFHEIRTMRQWLPYAILTGHAMDIYEPGIGALFNGISIGFRTANVIEGEESFGQVRDAYQSWQRWAVQPAVTMFEASPVDQIAYGYSYAPEQRVPPTTLEFARTYYPWMRFGLALTLLGDGYFAYEFGDTWHGNDWWYDELDFNLGYPLGQAARLPLPGELGPNLVANGDFEQPLAGDWQLWADDATGYQATAIRDTTDAAIGQAAARIEISTTGGVDWHVDFHQMNRVLAKNMDYAVSFWAKSDQPRTIALSTQKGSPEWDNYGLYQVVSITTDWQPYTITFTANATVNDSRLQFFLGALTGTVWLDEIQLRHSAPAIYQREFTNGQVLLNGTHEPQTIVVGPGWRRLRGKQAPRQQMIVDDSDPGFTTTGSWNVQIYASEEWQATGPFYHNWGANLHERSGPQGEAHWTLPITAADIYTVTAWWPAGPQAARWNSSVTYEVIADNQVVATQTFDQRKDGDQWHLIAAVPLKPTSAPFVRLRCAGTAPCVADALHVWSRARYNDGALADVVTLQPLDGIILQRISPMTQAQTLALPVIVSQAR